MSLVDIIHDHLKVHGPTEADDVRAALCVASAARFEAAVMLGIVEQRFERCSSGKSPTALRVPMDTRPVPRGPDHYLRRKTRPTKGTRYGADRDH